MAKVGQKVGWWRRLRTLHSCCMWVRGDPTLKESLSLQPWFTVNVRGYEYQSDLPLSKTYQVTRSQNYQRTNKLLHAHGNNARIWSAPNRDTFSGNIQPTILQNDQKQPTTCWPRSCRPVLVATGTSSPLTGWIDPTFWGSSRFVHNGKPR